MTHEAFERVLQEQLSLCTDILCRKSKEYSSQEDKLHNFKNAAGLQGVTQIQALSGMMAKHTISIYDMCMSDKAFPVELWEEKITDSINYLLLLKAAVIEEQGKPTTEQSSSVKLTQEIREEMFADVEPAKGKYEGWKPQDFFDKLCDNDCFYCPINKPEGEGSCINYAEAHPEEFRKIAIEYLEGLDKQN